MLACGTKPIIEASSNIQFGCFDVGYQGLTGVALQTCCFALEALSVILFLQLPHFLTGCSTAGDHRALKVPKLLERCL